MKNRWALLSIIIFAIPSCTTVEGGKKNFISSRNDDIGRKIELTYLPAADKIVPIDGGESQYHYSFKRPKDKSECSWLYVVSNESHLIKSWQYTSDPNYCYLTLPWGQPF